MRGLWKFLPVSDYGKHSQLINACRKALLSLSVKQPQSNTDFSSLMA